MLLIWTRFLKIFSRLCLWNTLGPAHNEFGYYEHTVFMNTSDLHQYLKSLDTTSTFLSIKLLFVNRSQCTSKNHLLTHWLWSCTFFLPPWSGCSTQHCWDLDSEHQLTPEGACQDNPEPPDPDKTILQDIICASEQRLANLHIVWA